MDSRNIIIPGGAIKVGDERIALEPSGNFESVEELRRTIVNLPGRKDVIYLEDIANIYRGFVDPVESKVKVNGHQGLAISVSLKDGGNIIDLGNGVEKTMDYLNSQYPIGIEFELIAYQHKIVDDKVNDFVNNLLQAVAVVLAVMLLFLGFRTGVVVASLVPSVMIVSLFIMGLFDIGLDQISLAALIIALGMLVDNAIVLSESIMVRIENGAKAFDAAIQASKELRIPLLTSSLTTSAAFLPIFLAKSAVGEYTAALFKVVTIALMTSWVLALTLIPMLCVMFFKIKQKEPDQKPNRFMAGYKTFLLFCLRRPAIFLVALLAVFIGVMNLFQFVPKKFFPDKDRNLVAVKIELPIGTAIERNEYVINQVEEYLRDSLQINDQRTDGVENWATWIGSSAPKYTLSYNPLPPSPENAYILMNTSNWEFDYQLADQLETWSKARFPDMSIVAAPLLNGPPVTIR